MAIILEGPDNSGKSTLAEAIQAKLGWEISHAGDACTPETVEARMLQDINNMQTEIIMDRSCIISETVYAPCLGNPVLFDSRAWFRKMQYLDGIGETMIFFCLPPLEQIVEKPRIQRVGEDQKYVDKVYANETKIYNQYVTLSNAMRIFIDISVINPFEQTDEVLSMVEWYAGRGK